MQRSTRWKAARRGDDAIRNRSASALTRVSIRSNDGGPLRPENQGRRTALGAPPRPQTARAMPRDSVTSLDPSQTVLARPTRSPTAKRGQRDSSRLLSMSSAPRLGGEHPARGSAPTKTESRDQSGAGPAQNGKRGASGGCRHSAMGNAPIIATPNTIGTVAWGHARRSRTS